MGLTVLPSVCRATLATIRCIVDVASHVDCSVRVGFSELCSRAVVFCLHRSHFMSTALALVNRCTSKSKSALWHFVLVDVCCTLTYCNSYVSLLDWCLQTGVWFNCWVYVSRPGVSIDKTELLRSTTTKVPAPFIASPLQQCTYK